MADEKKAELKEVAPVKRDYPNIKIPPPGKKARAVVRRDEKHSSSSYIKVYPLVVERGRGAMIEDVDGNKFIDFMAGIAVASTGHAHPKVVEAMRVASEKFLHICGTDFYYESMADLCARLANLGPGRSNKRVFLTNSGTEAVEGAIKLARNATRRSELIAFRGAFHGRSMGAMSLTSSKVAQRGTFGPLLPGVHHVPYPDPYRLETGGRNAGDFIIDHIRKDLFQTHVSPQDVAAIFVEPMLGEGGYVIPPVEFLQGLRELCNDFGIVLVFDEIQSGIGRTGHMWAADYFGVVPDVLLSAKGLGSGMPIGAIIAKQAVMKWESGSHGSTFGGNPVACAAALATLDLVENELAANARVMGERLMSGMKMLQKKYDCIGDVRGVGLFIGVEFVRDKETKEPAKRLVNDLMQRAFQKGLLLLSCGQSCIRLAPPLVIDEYDVDTGLAIIDECLDELT